MLQRTISMEAVKSGNAPSDEVPYFHEVGTTQLCVPMGALTALLIHLQMSHSALNGVEATVAQGSVEEGLRPYPGSVCSVPCTEGGSFRGKLTASAKAHWQSSSTQLCTLNLHN